MIEAGVPRSTACIQEAIQAGFVRSVDDFIDTAIEARPHRKGVSREDAVRDMQESGEKYHLSLGERVTRKLFHEGHRL